MPRKHQDPARDNSSATRSEKNSVPSGRSQKAMGGFIEKFKPEAVYFMEVDGQRAGFFVFDMNGSHQVPEVAEPLSTLAAEFTLRHA
jgi:hypothetical protein